MTYSEEDQYEIKKALESLFYHFDKTLPSNKAATIIQEAEQSFTKGQFLEAINRTKYSDRLFMTKDIFKHAHNLCIVNKVDVRPDCVYCDREGNMTCVRDDGTEYYIACICENKERSLERYDEARHNVKYPIHDFKMTEKEQMIYDRLKECESKSDVMAVAKEAGFEL